MEQDGNDNHDDADDDHDHDTKPPPQADPYPELHHTVAEADPNPNRGGEPHHRRQNHATWKGEPHRDHMFELVFRGFAKRSTPIPFVLYFTGKPCQKAIDPRGTCGGADA